jgi:hypothetical protein
VDSIRRLLSGDEVSIMRSQAGLGRELYSPGLELEQELGWSGGDHLVLYSNDLPMLSVDALGEVLAGVSFSIDGEDDLLEWILSLGEEYRPLLRWIAIRFLSPRGLAALFDGLVFPPEWLFHCVIGRFNVPSGFDSVILSHIP